MTTLRKKWIVGILVIVGITGWLIGDSFPIRDVGVPDVDTHDVIREAQIMDGDFPIRIFIFRYTVVENSAKKKAVIGRTFFGIPVQRIEWSFDR